jgi:uncharacterized protein (TIGR04222 family)
MSMTTHVLSNLLDLRGPQFLGVYALLFATALAVAFLLRRVMSGPPQVPPEAHRLGPYEIAAIAGGERLAINTAIASLCQQNVLMPQPGSRSVELTGATPRLSDPLERMIYGFVNSVGKRTVHEVHRKVPVGLAVRRPTELGLLLPPQARLAAALTSAAPMFALLVLGINKVLIGVTRNRPVLFLILFCILTLYVAIILVIKAPRRSRAGEALLAELKSRNVALQSTARVAPLSLATGELALAMALFGPAVLASTEMNALRKSIVSDRQAATSSCGGGCGTGSSCGGSGGGGGCGGGGCGGGCGGCGS